MVKGKKARDLVTSAFNQVGFVVVSRFIAYGNGVTEKHLKLKMPIGPYIPLTKDYRMPNGIQLPKYLIDMANGIRNINIDYQFRL